jgi:hypothetical protein
VFARLGSAMQRQHAKPSDNATAAVPSHTLREAECRASPQPPRVHWAVSRAGARLQDGLAAAAGRVREHRRRAEVVAAQAAAARRAGLQPRQRRQQQRQRAAQAAAPHRGWFSALFPNFPIARLPGLHNTGSSPAGHTLMKVRGRACTCGRPG